MEEFKFEAKHEEEKLKKKIQKFEERVEQLNEENAKLLQDLELYRENKLHFGKTSTDKTTFDDEKVIMIFFLNT